MGCRKSRLGHVPDWQLVSFILALYVNEED